MAKKVQGITVVAKRDGFRRCGRVFGQQPSSIPLSELKRGELERFKADPMLVVTEGEIVVEDEEKRPEPKK